MTLKTLLLNTHRYKRNRFEYKKRDKLKVIRIETIKSYDPRTLKEKSTKYKITTRSTPQYYPYYTKKDKWGRTRTYQKKYHHEYDVVLKLDEMSINSTFKARVGSQAKWVFGNKLGAYKRPNGVVHESVNVNKGINGDFFFNCEYVYAKNGILYGRCNAKKPPIKTNPKQIVYAPKHLLMVIEELLKHGFLKGK